MWKLMSVVYWGEVPLGTWQLSVLDKRDNGLDGNLSAFILAMYGKCAASASSTTYQDFDSECATSQIPSSAPTSAPSSAPSNAPSSAPTSATTTLATDGDDNDTTTTLATVSGSFVLTAESGTRAVLCQASNLAVGGRTYTAVEDAFNMSVVSLEDIVTLTLSCPETTLRRECRLQEESFEISFQAAFSDTSSADTFSSELTDASTASDLGSHFESLVSEIFNFSVSATVAVTADDDNDGESSGVFGNGERVAAYFVLSVMGFFM